MAQNLPNHFSASSLSTYKDCPRAYFYKYVAKLKLPEKSINLVFGSAVHSALEETMDPMTVYTREYTKRALKPEEWKDYDKLLPIGELIIKKFFEQKDFLYKLYDISPEGDSESTINMILENPLTKEQLPIPMHGRIDRLSKNGKILEYKTSSKLYNPKEESFGFQAKLYALWYWSKYHKLPNEIIYFVFVKDPKVLNSKKPIQVINFKVSLEELAETFDQVQTILSQIEQGFFYRGKHKPYCDCKKYDTMLVQNIKEEWEEQELTGLVLPSQKKIETNG